MNSSLTQIVPVVGAVPGTLVEVVPGKKFVPLPITAVPPVAIAELVPAGDGTYRVVARICPQWFTCQSANLRKLGIGISGTSMLRLIRAGFVDGQQTTPQVHQFDYYSYQGHMQRAADPEFWDRTEAGYRKTNRQRYREVL